jgi:Protein of unknown function (DUF3667)
MITCLNCKTSFEGKYCPNCSQEAHVGRITWKDILHQLPHGLFHLDGGLLHTAKELTVRPGLALREYLEGKRVNHFNPFLYLMLTGGLVTFLFLYFKLKLILQDYNITAIEHKNHFLGAKYFVILGGFWIFLSSMIDVLLHRSNHYNFAEMIIANTYQTAHVMLLLLIYMPVLVLQKYYFSDSILDFDLRVLFEFVVYAFLFYARYQLFRERSKWVAVLKIVLYLSVMTIALKYLPKLILN